MVEKSLYTDTGKLTIDMTYYGFAVESENPVGGGGGGCASAGSCGSASGGCGC